MLFSIVVQNPVFAQNQLVGVNNFTGTPVVNIPLFDVRCGSLSAPVNLIYSNNGIKVKDTEGSAGIGWNIMAGGEIARKVRGLPDDYRESTGTRVGWLYSTANINGFIPQNDNNSGTCTDETADVNNLTAGFYGSVDTEPDQFYVNAPGLSCQLVLDNTGTFRVMPYQDVRISVVKDSPTGQIRTITVTNDKGVSYQFGGVKLDGTLAVDYVSKKTTTSASTISYFNRYYNQYAGGVSHRTSWKLLKMSDAKGDQIIFDYDKERIASKTPLSLILGSATVATAQFTTAETTDMQVLKNIKVSFDDDIISNVLTFAHIVPASASYSPVISSVTGYGVTKTLSYDTYNFAVSGGNYSRTFLRGLQVQDKYYKFEYAGVTGYSLIDLPDSTSKRIDYWGYYNSNGSNTLTPQLYIAPSLADKYYLTQPSGITAYTIGGAMRTVDPVYTANGSLIRIVSSDGGTSNIEYESNDYYDPVAQTTVKGGGVRVKKLTHSDGLSSARNQVTTYSYLNPTTGLTSGKPISLPVYSFTTPYTGSGTTEAKWNASTIRSETDLSDDNESIVYSHVRVDKAGAGYLQYEYSNPATQWDVTSLPDWSAIVVNQARVSCTAVTLLSNARNTYPFAPAMDFSFERGLVKNVFAYDQNNTKVSESNYTYQRIASPVFITGLIFDDNTVTAKSYAKYSIYTGTGKQLSQVVNKTYDPTSPTTFQQTVTAYNYNSTAHKLLTSQQITFQDGTIQRIFNKYVKDYPASAVTDPFISGIYNLQQNSTNALVETYTQVERNGVNKTVAAVLNKYKLFNGYSAMTAQKLQIASPNGLSDFQPSSVSGSNTLQADSRYKVVENDVLYDSFGSLLTVDNDKRQVKTILTDFYAGNVIATITNARADEIAYNPYGSSSYTGFSGAASGITNGHGGSLAASIAAGNVQSRQINKNPLAQNYIFSIWLKPATSGTITVSLVTSGNVTSSYPLTYVAGTDWKYYELKVPVSGMTATFTASFSSSNTILTDDVLFYPEKAEVTTYAYNSTHQKISETNTNGVSSYFTYDDLQRPKLVLDQDRNIVSRKKYADYVPPVTYIYVKLNELNYYQGTDNHYYMNYKFETFSNAACTIPYYLGSNLTVNYKVTKTVSTPTIPPSVTSTNYTTTISAGLKSKTITLDVSDCNPPLASIIANAKSGGGETNSVPPGAQTCTTAYPTLLIGSGYRIYGYLEE